MHCRNCENKRNGPIKKINIGGNKHVYNMFEEYNWGIYICMCGNCTFVTFYLVLLLFLNWGFRWQLSRVVVEERDYKSPGK